MLLNALSYPARQIQSSFFFFLSAGAEASRGNRNLPKVSEVGCKSDPSSSSFPAFIPFLPSSASSVSFSFGSGLSNETCSG